MLGRLKWAGKRRAGAAPAPAGDDRLAIPAPEFDEALYLRLNPDVAAKVEAEPGSAAGATSSSRGGSRTAFGVPPSRLRGGPDGRRIMNSIMCFHPHS